jgi:hypothetical protein
MRPSTLLLLATALACSACQSRAQFADLVFTGGKVITMDSANATAQAVAIRAGRIVYVGTDAGADQWIGTATRVIPLGGRTVLPGFEDAHVHPIGAGFNMAGCDLTEYPTRPAVLARVRTCADSLPAGEWLVGSNWALPLFPEANPQREWLDSLTPGRPAFLRAADGHSAWVNTEALARAGITAKTPDPINGRIERNQKGEPTGTLRESAIDLVQSQITEPTPEQRRTALKRAVVELNRVGVTAFHEASAGRADLEAYRELDQRGELTARVLVSMLAEPTLGLEQVDSLVAWRKEFQGPHVFPMAVKIFADGVIEARTAAMLAPYLDKQDDAGTPNWPAARLDSLVAKLVDNDFSVHVHAIGDGAVRMTLDAMEAAERGKTRGTRRHQIAHLEVIDSADVPRFASLGVIANFQALWGFPDSYIRDLTLPALGPERSRWLYPIGSVAKAGGRLAFGSDWPVSSPMPLLAIQVAMTRQDPADPAGATLLPEQAIDLQTALRAYTLGSAYALGIESETGSLTVGKAADLVVLAEDIGRVSPTHLGKVLVQLTMLEGRPVYGDLATLEPKPAP